MSAATAIARRASTLLVGQHFRAFHTSRVAFAAAEPLNSFVVAIATPRPTPPPPPPPSASVPFMITGTQRQKLYELSYTREDVDALSPSDALNIIKWGLSRDAFSAQVRATWQRKPQIDLEVPDVICLGGATVEGKSTPSPQPPATASAEAPSSLQSSSPSESEQYRRRRRSEEQRPH